MSDLTVLAMFLRPRGPTVDYLRRIAGAITCHVGRNLRLIAGDRESRIIAPESITFADELLRCRQPVTVEQVESAMLSRDRFLLITDYPNLINLTSRYCGDLDEFDEMIIVNLSDFDPPRSPLLRQRTYLPYSTRIPELLVAELNRILKGRQRFQNSGRQSRRLIGRLMRELEQSRFEAPRFGRRLIEVMHPLWLRRWVETDELIRTVIPLITDHRRGIVGAVLERVIEIVDAVGSDDSVTSTAPGSEQCRVSHLGRLSANELGSIGESLLEPIDHPELSIASPVYRARKLFEPFGIDELKDRFVIPESPGRWDLYCEFNGESLDPLFQAIIRRSPSSWLAEARIVEYAPTTSSITAESGEQAVFRFIHRKLLSQSDEFDDSIYRLIEYYCRTEMSPQIRDLLLIDLLGVGPAIARGVRPAPRAEVNGEATLKELLTEIERRWPVDLQPMYNALLEQPRRLFEESFGLELSKDGVSLREMRRITSLYFR